MNDCPAAHRHIFLPGEYTTAAKKAMRKQQEEEKNAKQQEEAAAKADTADKDGEATTKPTQKIAKKSGSKTAAKEEEKKGDADVAGTKNGKKSRAEPKGTKRKATQGKNPEVEPVLKRAATNGENKKQTSKPPELFSLYDSRRGNSRPTDGQHHSNLISGRPKGWGEIVWGTSWHKLWLLLVSM